MRWQRLYNPLVGALVRSPLHGLISGSTLLLTVRGRRSGERHTFPVGYVRDGGALLVLSRNDRHWWRNLRGGAPVRVVLRGQALAGNGTVAEDPAEVSEHLLLLLRRAPRYQRSVGVQLSPAGRPRDPDALRRQAETKVVIRIADLGPSTTGGRQ